MFPHKRGFVWFFMVSLLLLGLSNCSDQNSGASNDSQRGNRGGPNSQSAAIPVQAEPVARGDISRFLLQTTTIEAERQVDILAKVSGQVQELNAEEGMRVREGQVLAKLDEAELTINYLRTKVSYETDKSVYERSKEMLEKDFIATEDYEAARLQFESSKAAYKAAELQLEYTNIRAPFTGIVTTRNIELGQRINVNQSLFTLADFNPLRAKIYVPEKDISQIFEGQEALISVEAQPDTEFKGIVKMISPVVDPESGTSKVTIDIEEPSLLKPGMFASVYITTETHTNTLIIPKESLVLETDVNQVYIYRDGSAHKVNLELGFTSGEKVEVLSGLQEGELVATAGQDGLREGLPIRIPGLEEPEQRFAENQPVQTENVAIDPERLQRIEERMLQNAEIKKEYDKRIQEDPDMKNNPGKKLAFFREMRQARQGQRL
jgi:membrane fusion protein (multidrug efflux system)